MNCVSPILITKNLSRLKYPDGLEVPCGKCLLCRITRRKEWALRMIHELDSWDKSVFVTLTYDDGHIPKNNSLVKSDLQKYFKRLRKEVHPEKIKYFACGEYGDTTSRPHYHAIIFGLSLSDSQLLKAKWPYGFIQLGLAEPESIRYVAQYIDKKFSGDLAIEEYDNKNREPVFRILSQGIGENFVLSNKDQIISNEELTMFGVPHSIPRYYLKKLGLENTDFKKQKAINAEYEMMEHYTGISDIDFLTFYMTQNSKDVRSIVERIKSSRTQKQKNAYAKIMLKKSKL